ncbi:MAG TPA: peptidase, partial [Burkholderiaceae bacterium]|nr:peptidase [Burkholderiaceae bacterium]
MRALPDFAAIVRRNGPAVVNVSVVQSARRVPDKNAIDGEEPLLDLLRRLGLPIARGPAYGIGSGFIVRPDGVIL